ncbi:MAG: hypothetical protein IJ568_07565 [Bacilli bacterium]|nr:hypothetical protein [Bacilli bacterium]
MALMLDKKTSKKLENRLNEFKEYGMTLYYLLEENRTSMKDLENIFFSKDDEKSSFIYSKILKHTKPSDLNKAFEKYKNSENSDNLDENVLKKHLNVIYTKKIIDLIKKECSDTIDKTYVNTYDYLITNIVNK